MESAFLLPEIDAPESASFWAGTAEGELRVQRCGVCDEPRMPPRPMCPACRSLEVVWKPSSGRGRVWSFVVPHPPLLPAYAEVAPYNVVVVELEENPAIRFVGNLVASAEASLDSVDPETISIGASVEVVFPAAVDGVVLPRWVLVQAA